METLKVRYLGKGHTVVKINGEEIRVLENEVITINSNEKDKFLSNDFIVVGGRDENTVRSQIGILKEDILNEEKNFKRICDDIKLKAKNEIEVLKQKFDIDQSDRNERLKNLEKDLDFCLEEKEILKKEKQAEIDKLIAEKNELEGNVNVKIEENINDTTVISNENNENENVTLETTSGEKIEIKKNK